MLKIKGWQKRKKANKTVRTIGFGYLKQYGGYMYVKAFIRYLYGIWRANPRLRQFVYLGVSVLSIMSIYICKTYMTQYNRQNAVQVSSIRQMRPLVNTQTTKLARQTAVLSKYQISTNATLRSIYGNLTTVFTSMYSYQDGDNYVANRKAVMKYFDRSVLKKLNNVYSTGVDTAGQNMIDALHQQGTLQNLSLYTTKEGILGTDSIYEFTAVVSFTSTQDSSAKGASHERMATYHIQWDNSAKKIIQFDQVNLVKSGMKYGQ